jgi:hypothetical protein
MPEQKTKPTSADVNEFLDRVADPERRADARTLVKLMRDATGCPPRMWGPSMIGFGSYHYVYDSGHEGDIFLTGFSPRKNALVLYLMGGFDERFMELLKRLGKAKTGKACLYIKKLADVDLTVLQELIEKSLTCLAQTCDAARQRQTAAKKTRKS